MSSCFGLLFQTSPAFSTSVQVSSLTLSFLRIHRISFAGTPHHGLYSSPHSPHQPHSSSHMVTSFPVPPQKLSTAAVRSSCFSGFPSSLSSSSPLNPASTSDGNSIFSTIRPIFPPPVLAGTLESPFCSCGQGRKDPLVVVLLPSAVSEKRSYWIYQNVDPRSIRSTHTSMREVFQKESCKARRRSTYLNSSDLRQVLLNSHPRVLCLLLTLRHVIDRLHMHLRGPLMVRHSVRGLKSFPARTEAFLLLLLLLLLLNLVCLPVLLQRRGGGERFAALLAAPARLFRSLLFV